MSSRLILSKGDIGAVFEVSLITESGTAVDVSTATGGSDKLLVLRSPSGVVKSLAASFVSSGTDGKIRYTTTSTDLDEVGGWERQWQVQLRSGGSVVGSLSTPVVKFEVGEKIA